ncbi:MAG TPA: hypothetical protein VGR48_03160 [Terriglobales bacterium]|nr:hypothetical protein [Terriglobales bacterium]
MMSRSSAFIVAACLLAGFRIFLSWARRKHGLFLPVATTSDNWSLFDLLLASFLTLFAELAFIR